MDVIVRDGNVLSLNTRSLLALRRGGVDPSDFVVNNRSGNEFFENLLDERLKRNSLDSAGTETLRITGFGRNASSVE